MEESSRKVQKASTHPLIAKESSPRWQGASREAHACQLLNMATPRGQWKKSPGRGISHICSSIVADCAADDAHGSVIDADTSTLQTVEAVR